MQEHKYQEQRHKEHFTCTITCKYETAGFIIKSSVQLHLGFEENILEVVYLAKCW